MKRSDIFAITVFLLTIQISTSYKIVIFVPTLSNSQILFNYRIGELLASAGHEVTLYRPQYNAEATKGKTKLCKEFRLRMVNESKFTEIHDKMQGPIFESTSTMTMPWSTMREFMTFMRDACEAQIQNPEVMKMLKEQDLAIVHPYDFCPLGLIHVAKVPTHIWMSSTVFLEFMAKVVGAPNVPSYVPLVMSANSERMTFWQRSKNAIGLVGMYLIIEGLIVKPQEELFQKHFGADFPSLLTLASKVPLVFVNSVEFLDFPRPILHKVVYMGGIGMQAPEALSPEWEAIMENSHSGVVLISFGSVANSSLMPLEMKMAFLGAISNFPTYNFIWKYESNDFVEAKRYKNLHLSAWVPQVDLFGHPKLRCFVSHGGFNSFLESSHAGIPLLFIPLFADQYGSARRAEKHGYGRYIQKNNVTAQSLTENLKEIFANPSYTQNAKRMAAMLKKKPSKSEDLVVRWVEFLAEFKELSNLEPAFKDLNFFQYFLLDVFAALILVFVLFICFWIALCRWCCRRHSGTAQKQKSQ